MYYLTSRYYNPSWGRFITADVFVSTGQGIVGNNMFAYCGNNPVMGYDPDGHWDWRIITDVLVTAVAALTAAVVTVVETVALRSPVSAVSNGIKTFGAINNFANKIYYENISPGTTTVDESDTENSAYVDKYISRWDRLDLTRVETKSTKYDSTAALYYSEYSVHMYGWYAVGWAYEKEIPKLSTMASSLKKADVTPGQLDPRPIVKVATILWSFIGL